MSRRKGLSYEEKRDRAKEYLWETKGIFTMKQLEGLLSKHKGIVPQSVAEVVGSLVDDGGARMEKIGTSNFYWSFPSQALNTQNNRRSELETALAASKRRRDELASELAQAKVGRADCAARTQRIEHWKRLKEESAQLSERLAVLRENDPALLAALDADFRSAVAAANRWTDNIFAMKSYCRDHFNIDSVAFDKGFGVDDALDYIDVALATVPVAKKRSFADMIGDGGADAGGGEGDE